MRTQRNRTALNPSKDAACRAPEVGTGCLGTERGGWITLGGRQPAGVLQEGAFELSEGRAGGTAKGWARGRERVQGHDET